MWIFTPKHLKTKSKQNLRATHSKSVSFLNESVYLNKSFWLSGWLNKLIKTVTYHQPLGYWCNMQKNNHWKPNTKRCGNIYHCSVKVAGQNSVILIGIWAIGSSVWEQKSSQCRFRSSSSWSCNFALLTNRKLLGLTTV